MKLKNLNRSAAAFVLALSLFNCQPEKRTLLLPVYGEKTTTGSDTVYHQIGRFSLVNQYGDTVTESAMHGKICVSNFFFATCKSICPEMSTNLVDVQKEFASDDSIRIFSHSVNPIHDTVEVLMSYAAQYGAQKNKWDLLTGDKKTIYDLAKNGYLVNAIEDDGSPEGFLHSELFLLVDTKGRIRGMYDGTDKSQVQKLIADIRKLKQEKF